MSEPTSALPVAGTRRGAAIGADWATLARTYGAFAALAALILYNISFTPNFLTAGTLNANLTQVATIVIVAVGMTFVIATGGVDLSVGSLMAIAAVVAPMFLLDG